MTTETKQACTAIVSAPYIEAVVTANHVCGAEAGWLDWFDGPRCDEHAVGHCRRIGVVEGEEA